jgi:hypothetical protein
VCAESGLVRAAVPEALRSNAPGLSPRSPDMGAKAAETQLIAGTDSDFPTDILTLHKLDTAPSERLRTLASPGVCVYCDARRVQSAARVKAHRGRKRK